jgi:hypothetical protein
MAAWNPLSFAPEEQVAERFVMTAESILLAILVVLFLILALAGLATVLLAKIIREVRAGQQAMRRVIANMDWTSVLSNMHSSSKESVRLLDIIDKRLQKLEALEKLQISQSQFNVSRATPAARK